MIDIEHTWIPLSDGTRLAARIWLPDEAERHPVPALLEYLPYRKRDGTRERDALTHPYLAGHGYACARVDIRGCGESEGLLDDEYSRQEQEDALEVIAWLARQTWCSGAVGMFGISWGGFNALQVAALRPPALKAIVTLCSTDDRWRDEVHYMGGAKLTAGFDWAAYFFAEMCRPPDPALVGARWREMWLQRLQHLPLFLERWLQHQRRDDYWRHGSVCEDYAAIECPVYVVGGWTDGYTNAIPRLLQHLDVPRKGLIGPWAHGYPHVALPGPQIGFLQEMLRWWDHWLKGKHTGVMDEPMLRLWMGDSVHPATWHKCLPGRWVAEPTWPPPDLKCRRLHLADGGLCTTSAPLSPQAIRSPLGVGRQAGEWCPFGRGHDQAGDQREDDEGSRCFDTEPLGHTVELLGAPALTLELTSDKPIALLVARLCDVHPSGESHRVSFGVLNLAHREDSARPTPLVPGQRYQVRLPLKHAAMAFASGHRIRLALSTSYWPMVWPAPERATVTVLGGSLDLPTRPMRSEPDLPALPTPAMAPPEPMRRMRHGVTRFDAIDLETVSQSKFSHDIDGDDPLGAVASMHRSDALARGDWRVRIDTQMRLSCTRHSFLLTASLRAFEGDREICRRDWESSISRDLL